MASEHYVIIGNGVAANSAADILRQSDPDSRITLISREFFPFYYRHKLRFFISDELREDQLLVCPPTQYREQNVRLRLGQEVQRVDLKEKTLYLSDEFLVKLGYLEGEPTLEVPAEGEEMKPWAP